LAKAYGVSTTYAYEYAVPPGYHGLDLCWTFAPNFTLKFNNTNICRNVSLEYKAEFQSYLVNFAMTGDPNSGNPEVPWKTFGDAMNANVLQILSGFSNVVDKEVPPDRCGFWQTAPYCTTCASATARFDSFINE
jgi:carboxylesterase type B